MFLVLAWPGDSQLGRRTGETHGRGRNRRGSEASTRRTARIARSAARSFAAGGSEADREGAAKSERSALAAALRAIDRCSGWRGRDWLGSGQTGRVLGLPDVSAVLRTDAVLRVR